MRAGQGSWLVDTGNVLLYVEDGERTGDAVKRSIWNDAIYYYLRSSYKGHTVDALAPGVEEGRRKLRKATVSRKQA